MKPAKGVSGGGEAPPLWAERLAANKLIMRQLKLKTQIDIQNFLVELWHFRITGTNGD